MNSLEYSIHRIGNQEYNVKTSDGSNLNFVLTDSKLDPTTSYNLVRKSAKLIMDRISDSSKKEEITDTIRFNYGSKRWKVSRSDLFKWYHKILFTIFPFLWHTYSQKTAHFTIDTAIFGPQKKEHPRDIADLKRKSLKKWKSAGGSSLDRANFRRYSQDIQAANQNKGAHFESITQADYLKGLRGCILFKTPKDPEVSLYSDPYTELAELAFQRYEKSYNVPDDATLESSDYRFIKRGEHLELVHKSSHLATPIEMQAAVHAFKSHMIEVWGERKMHRIDQQFGLNLEEGRVLTPEHIYRFNIGTTNSEIQDIEEVVLQLREMHHNIQPADLKKSFREFAFSKMPASVIWGIEKQGACATVKDFSRFMKSVPGLEGEIESLNPEKLNQLISALQPNFEDFEKAYTGRKIAEVIESAYTTAGEGIYKPYIDQQELTQTFRELSECNSMHSFHELLGHIVSKKHLARQHPDEIFRVGALIPAPPEKKGGPIRWYKVTSFITNSYIHGYTLEEACKGSNLDAIKLYRSTASSPYALNSTGSLVTDFSYFNSPGYTGIRLLEPYERDFFHSRSMPLWVGYQVAAQNRFDKKSLPDSDQNLEIFQLLTKSNERLFEDENRFYASKNMREILRENDAILNELFLHFEGILNAKNKVQTIEKLSKFSKPYSKLMKHMIARYIQPSLAEVDKIPKEITTHDAHELFDLLENMRFCIQDEDSREKALLENVLASIADNFIGDEGETKRKLQKLHFYNNTYMPFLRLKLEAFTLLNLGKEEEAYDKMQEWSLAIRDYAVLRGENPESKIMQNVIGSGHSLGGACAAVMMVHYFSNENRIPLEGCSAGTFEFDNPALNHEDNERFKKMGNDNVHLLKDLNIRFNIVRRVEASDPLSLYGEVHLGATYTEEETKEVEQWVRFDAAIHEMLPTSDHRPIAELKTPHARRFLEGKRFRTFSPEDNVGGDYIQTYYSPLIQGIFDTKGNNLGKESTNVKEVLREKKKRRKMFQFLYKERWKLIPVFEALVRDDIRKSVHGIFQSLRKFFFSKRQVDLHVIPDELLDRNGCFAVTLQEGIISAKIDPIGG